MHLLPISSRETIPDFDAASRLFEDVVAIRGLDDWIARNPRTARELHSAVDRAVVSAYGEDGDGSAHLFLQRALYRINRFKLFWYDDLERYDNERSDFLRALRDRIEDEWQRWEMQTHDVDALRALDVEGALEQRAAADVDPPRSDTGDYFARRAGEAAYRRLVEIASLDGLVEASQLSRTLGGVSNEIHSTLTRLLLEEYGYGRLPRKHSSYFECMLRELDMDTSPEAYYERVPWPVLAAINHSFLLSERKRYFLRYIGGLLYTETSVPAAFSAYRDCAERLGLSEAGRAYWDLHIREDERHGRWMLNDVALPLARRYPSHAWELVLGYDQQRALSDRAGAAVAAEARLAEEAQSTHAPRVTV